jgi:hypothetical protein
MREAPSCKVVEALGAPGADARLVASLRERMAAVESIALRLASRPRVACIDWIELLMSGGNWMPEIVAMAGGASLFGQAGKHSPWLDWDDLRAADPDVVFVSPAASISRVPSPRCRSSRSARLARAPRNGDQNLDLVSTAEESAVKRIALPLLLVVSLASSALSDCATGSAVAGAAGGAYAGDKLGKGGKGATYGSAAAGRALGAFACL